MPEAYQQDGSAVLEKIVDMNIKHSGAVSIGSDGENFRLARSHGKTDQSGSSPKSGLQGGVKIQRGNDRAISS